MMSKILWKALFASPAILGAALLMSADAARAAEGKTPLTVEDRLTAEVTIEPSAIAIAAAPTAPEAEVVSAFSDKIEPEAGEAIGAEISVPELVEVPAAAPTIAQAAPTAGNEDVLEQINRYSQEGSGNARDQVTNVSQLSDVSPGDWAFEALRSLVERYGCIAGYPDGTYRGNRAMTRYEFAAGLNACLQQIESLIAGLDFVTREDLETLQRLIQEFEAELATLGTRVDNLEGRVAFLEDNQFSTTTKLVGEAIFALTDEFNTDFESNTVFQDRVRLTLQTSFTGRDTLNTRLTAGNAGDETQFALPGDTREGIQTFNVFSTNGNDVIIDWLSYYFPFGESQIYVAAFGGIHSDYAPTLNPFFEDFDGGNGALSAFATENPIYRIGGGAGGAVNFSFGPVDITGGYLAGPGAESPTEDNGLFNGEYAALGQVNFNIGDRIGIGATYVHAYHNAGTDIFDLGSGGDLGVVGTSIANRPSAFLAGIGGGEVPTVTNSYGVEAAFRLTDSISISGFGTYTDAILIGRGDAEIWTYGAGVALADLGKEGSVLGVFGGVQPYAGNISVPGPDFRRGDDDNLPYHIEAFYKYQVTENISVTPGVIWLLAPNQDDDNDDAVIGTLRTTFTF